MDSSKLAIKIYLADGVAAPTAAMIVPIFHAWIQSHELPHHVLIDVADYAHVPSGPGILLVADEANIYLDELDGRWGLTYSRKRPIDGSLADRIRFTFAQASRCAAMLEANPALGGAVRFSASEFSFKINDRLHAPNSAETYTAIAPALQSVCTDLFGPGAFNLDHKPDALRLFEVAIRASVQPSDLKSLLGKADRPVVPA